MEACRACLATGTAMNPLDEAFVTGYNLLTNLNVAVLDAMPQYVCQSCTETVKSYLDFREHCITTEKSLREVILQGLKAEDDKPLSELKNEGVKVKQEVKEEENDDFDFGQTYFNEDLLDHVKSEKKEDLKPKKRKYKKRKTKALKTERAKPKAVKIEKVKPELEFLSCGLCKETYADVKELTDHVESHKNEKKCRLCSASFEHWPALVGHRFTHLPEKEFRCHVCRKGWYCGASTAISMEYHYMNRHYDGVKTKFSCKLCFRKYESPRKLNKHMNMTHTKKCFICDYCNKSCTTKPLLRTHIRCHSDNRSYVCELCGFASKHSGGLKDHKIRKHAPAKVKCVDCQRWFANAADKDKHVCNVEPKICPICGINIDKSKNYSRHMEAHSDIKRYKCKRCPAEYKTRYALIAHNNRHDGNRPVQCPFCPQKFYTHSVLIKHKRIHTGEKPYVCKVCHKGFTGNHNLKVHMKVHGENLVVPRNKPDDAPSFFSLPPLVPMFPQPARHDDNDSIELD